MLKHQCAVKVQSDIEYYNSTSVAKSLKNNKSEDIDSEDETNNNRRPYQRPQKAGKRQLFESDEEGSNKQSDQRPRKLTKKVVRDTKAVYESDDEESNKTTNKVLKKSTSRRKTASRPSAEPRGRPAAAGWNLNLGDEAEEIEASRARKPGNVLQSVLTRRVADGCLRRTAKLSGDLFVELRLYNTKEIKCVEPRDRWQQSVLSLKYQTDSGADELDFLRQFIQRARGKFLKEGTFFVDKKK
ncbi:hypothetical protein ACJJTC_016509 [Scirpophaga incertulas]